MGQREPSSNPGDPTTVRPEPILPDYGGACISNLFPALAQHREIGRGWIPDAALAAKQVVLLVIDGLGIKQLRDRPEFAPNLLGLEGDPITTVAPSTTAAALTSISTGLAPTQHGVVGYKIRTGGETLNVLRWGTQNGDARDRIDPMDFQATPIFAGQEPPVVTKREFRGSGFTRCHLPEANLIGYSATSTLVTETRKAVGNGASFTYVYYDGIDRVAHEYGFGENYDRELRNVDRLVGDLLDGLDSDTALVVTADHGQVHVGQNHLLPDSAVSDLCQAESGEARFRWLHSRPGAAAALVDVASECHSDIAWVWSIEEIIDRRMLGPAPTPEIRSRLGDVAMVPFEPVAFVQPTDVRSLELVGRHGSLTPEEMLVPLLVGLGRL